MPKKGPDIEKIKLIRKVLKESPQGLWIREIARKTGLDKSTVSLYLAGYMADEIEDTHPDVKGDMIKAVRLKKVRR
jgi:transcriptional regulator with XRE-family HTH domain